MFAFSEEQKLVQQMVRRWVDAKLAPQNDALESGTLLPYDLMRDFAKTFDLPSTVKAGFAKMAERSQSDQPGRSDLSSLGGSDPALTAIIAIEPHGSGTRYTATALHRDEAARKKHEEMGFHKGWGTALDQLVAHAKKM